MTEPSLTQDTDTLTRPAAELRPGDRIAMTVLPLGAPGDVIFVHPYVSRIRDERWVFVAYVDERYGVEAERFRADAAIPLERAADDGMGYSREADDPTPVSPARGASSPTGYVVEGDHLVLDLPDGAANFRAGHLGAS